MGKGTTKKGKQKDAVPAAPVSALAPPPPSPPPSLTVPSPPSAHHIQYPSATIHTIEEQEELGGLSGGPAGSAEEQSWQDVGHSADGWANVPGNSKEDLSDDGWETGATQAPMPPSPSQPTQKKFGGGRDHTRSFYPQQSQNPSSTHRNPTTFRPDTGAHTGSATGWGQQHQNAWAPRGDGWAENNEWGGEDEEESADDEWEANDEWNGANSGWRQQPHSATWNRAVSSHSARPQATPHVPGWQSWGEEARRLPKVTFDPTIPSSPGSNESKTVLSQLQRSRILNALLNNPQQNQQPYPMPPNSGVSFAPAVANNWQQRQPPQPHPSLKQQHGQESRNKKIISQWQDQGAQRQNGSGRRRQAEVHDVWGLGDGWNDLPDEEEQQDMVQDAWGRKVHFSPSALRASMLPSSAAPSVAPSAVVENFTVNALPRNKLGISTIPMSKTLSYAYSGTTPSTESEPGRAAMQRITDFHFIESRGEALKDVQRAFYGKQRKATERFHWLFSPDKDERVSSLLNWIHSMSFGIASFGLQKFLQTRERGALIVNAAYRPVHSPSEPAFDWVSWNQIQQTMDRVLQESVGYYNPATHIIVFVLLPSPSGSSVAIWRRKLSIPNNIRLAYQAQITQAMASLRKDYPVYVDELPAPPEPIPPPPPKKKRKWYKLWLSS